MPLSEVPLMTMRTCSSSAFMDKVLIGRFGVRDSHGGIKGMRRE
jgi:hypothetical protein